VDPDLRRDDVEFRAIGQSNRDVMPAKAAPTQACQEQADGVLLVASGFESAAMKVPCVYLLASKRDGVLYIGVTSDIAHRMVEHSQGLIPGFSKTYSVKHLVYYEMHQTMDDAIRREKRLKEWRRAWKSG
jgi:putative endonuclease